MGTALASFVVSGFVFWHIQLRKIMVFYALLQRMEIFRAEWEKYRNFRSNAEFAVNFMKYYKSRNIRRVIFVINLLEFQDRNTRLSCSARPGVARESDQKCISYSFLNTRRIEFRVIFR